MFLRNSSFAAVLSLAFSAPAVAAPVEIDFSFDPIEISGTFYGLDDSDGTSQASSFDLMGGEDDYLSVDAATADKNEFTFDAGELTEVHFEITGPIPGEDGTGTLDYFAIILNTNGLFGETEETSSSGSKINIESGDPTLTVRTATVVPLPAGATLLLTGIAAVGGLRLRKKRAAQA